MVHKHYGITLAGGLILMLFATSCASKPARTTANPPPKDQAVASASTERQVPSNRVGSGDPRTPADRVVPCADDRGDMTASADCAPAPELLAACAHRTDANGRIIYNDPGCPKRYRTQVTQTQMGSSYQNIDWSQESAFFDRHMDKAVKHAREAEIAGNQGHGPDMLRHAELSLDYAKEAQRAGNVPGLNEGIFALRETLRQGDTIRHAGLPSDQAAREAQRADNVPGPTVSESTVPGSNEGIVAPGETQRYPGETQRYDAGLAEATSHVRDARIKLSQAAGMKPRDTAVAKTASMTGRAPRTVKGELVKDEAFTGSGGNRQYVLRDRTGQDTRILLTPDQHPDLKAGDMVEAQLDPDGRVVAINKY